MNDFISSMCFYDVRKYLENISYFFFFFFFHKIMMMMIYAFRLVGKQKCLGILAIYPIIKLLLYELFAVVYVRFLGFDSNKIN